MVGRLNPTNGTEVSLLVEARRSSPRVSSRSEARDLRRYSADLLKPTEDPSSLRSFGMTRPWINQNRVSSRCFSAAPFAHPRK